MAPERRGSHAKPGTVDLGSNAQLVIVGEARGWVEAPVIEPLSGVSRLSPKTFPLPNKVLQGQAAQRGWAVKLAMGSSLREALCRQKHQHFPRSCIGFLILPETGIPGVYGSLSGNRLARPGRGRRQLATGMPLNPGSPGNPGSIAPSSPGYPRRSRPLSRSRIPSSPPSSRPSSGRGRKPP